MKKLIFKFKFSPSELLHAAIIIIRCTIDSTTVNSFALFLSPNKIRTHTEFHSPEQKTQIGVD